MGWWVSNSLSQEKKDSRRFKTGQRHNSLKLSGISQPHNPSSPIWVDGCLEKCHETRNPSQLSKKVFDDTRKQKDSPKRIAEALFYIEELRILLFKSAIYGLSRLLTRMIFIKNVTTQECDICHINEFLGRKWPPKILKKFNIESLPWQVIQNWA